MTKVHKENYEGVSDSRANKRQSCDVFVFFFVFWREKNVGSLTTKPYIFMCRRSEKRLYVQTEGYHDRRQRQMTGRRRQFPRRSQTCFALHSTVVTRESYREVSFLFCLCKEKGKNVCVFRRQNIVCVVTCFSLLLAFCCLNFGWEEKREFYLTMESKTGMAMLEHRARRNRGSPSFHGSILVHAISSFPS